VALGLFPDEESVSGDMLAASGPATGPPQPPGSVVTIRARNQGGRDIWGEVQRTPSFSGVDLSGDTAFLGSPTTIDVYVADTDRDGLRDGIDLCARDPLNNITGGCARDTTSSPVLDDLIVLGDVTSETRADEFHITATFANASDIVIANPFFTVTELSGHNTFANGDAGPGGGIGATLSPDVGDGIWSPGETMTVTFVIDLETLNPFTFRISVGGETGF
jgi:hypothetical protein